MVLSGLIVPAVANHMEERWVSPGSVWMLGGSLGPPSWVGVEATGFEPSSPGAWSISCKHAFIVLLMSNWTKSRVPLFKYSFKERILAEGCRSWIPHDKWGIFCMSKVVDVLLDHFLENVLFFGYYWPSVNNLVLQDTQLLFERLEHNFGTAS